MLLFHVQSDRIHPICLPHDDQEFDSSDECIVAGWGVPQCTYCSIVYVKLGTK